MKLRVVRQRCKPKGVLFWLRLADEEHLCPRARWHIADEVCFVFLRWMFPPLYFFHGWVCRECE